MACETSKKSLGSSPIHQLSIKDAFESLTLQEKLYAHYMSRAAWHGARIVMRQVSPEAIEIYDFILELYRSCSGDWKNLGVRQGVDGNAMRGWLEYAAKFLSNLGNYYGSGDQKFVPDIEPDELRKLVSWSTRCSELYSRIKVPIFEIPPYNLGFPDSTAQSAYYPGSDGITRNEISMVSQTLEQRSVRPENTRIRKTMKQGQPVFDVLVASVEEDLQPAPVKSYDPGCSIRVVRGDHKTELKRICSCLRSATDYTANDVQKQAIARYIESFTSGSLETYRDSQRAWVADLGPRVENIFGFVEPYRDPYGIRAEFEGLVAISHPEETRALKRLVENSTKFIKRLPWAIDGGENDGKGPFEKELFEPPDFASIHSLAYCSSIIFPGINLPNYNDIREETGFKNVIVANRMSVESSSSELSPFVDLAESKTFQKHKFNAYYLWVVLHELVGHGTGKMMTEESPGKFNFDIHNPPVDPLTNEPISSWYKPGQTWTGQFEDLATTLDECRAELVGAYLMDDTELLALFGFSDQSEITSFDLTYNLYLQLGVDGLRGLQNYNIDSGSWGQAHSRAHFAILKCLLLDGEGFMTVDCRNDENSIIVRIDQSKILSHGKPALGNMLLKLHMYRCTADVQACRKYYEEMSRVHGKYLEWRNVVLAQKQPKWIFVHSNTFLKDGEVILKEYEPSLEGIIESWVQRDV